MEPTPLPMYLSPYKRNRVKKIHFLIIVIVLFGNIPCIDLVEPLLEVVYVHCHLDRRNPRCRDTHPPFHRRESSNVCETAPVSHLDVGKPSGGPWSRKCTETTSLKRGVDGLSTPGSPSDHTSSGTDTSLSGYRGRTDVGDSGTLVLILPRERPSRTPKVYSHMFRL